MISSQPSSEPSPNRLPPNHASGPHQILTNSAPDPPGAAARPLVQMPAADTPCDRAHSTALVAACQRIWAAPDVAALWRIVVDEAVALIAADGATVVTYTERFWQTLAACPSDAAPDDSAAAAVIEMLFRQGLLQQPISIDDLADGASWNGLGRRALLVVRIEGSSRQPVRLVWYASRPATLSPYADVAEAFAHHAREACTPALTASRL
jgi:hypothetical protein